MSRDWTLYLEDLAEACRLIEQFTSGMSAHSFASDALVFHATVRNLEIIGEAAKRLPDEAKARMPEVDWSGAARFRDVIVHRYFALDPAVVWSILQTKIPALSSAARRVLSEFDRGGSPESTG
ncbi:MAG: DUF86 domain-containing protein [Sterolibacteriaceae bacterium]|jgi:uncharacterized protein with HEPN domain|uniref:DUF86 domain-containing protein n=1 Tax=Candidatus Methylophosphatis roskildensis TaxID=2899263 RepID=A0A9D7E5X2_9PROT|nr:DUF86 domain-containing protein [Candidatus Methylophosphatis roskildensis]MBK7236584.1 DUF86 domain-containing protein [Sterolibacteriaceae bacterium]